LNPINSNSGNLIFNNNNNIKAPEEDHSIPLNGVLNISNNTGDNNDNNNNHNNDNNK
jgi:hypothetical protein